MCEKLSSELLQEVIDHPWKFTELKGGEVLLLQPNGETYWIGLDQLKDAASLLFWIDHISMKQWVTPGHIRELIMRAEIANGIKVNRDF